MTQMREDCFENAGKVKQDRFQSRLQHHVTLTAVAAAAIVGQYFS
jgi:hypothetical protein